MITTIKQLRGVYYEHYERSDDQTLHHKRIGGYVWCKYKDL